MSFYLSHSAEETISIGETIGNSIKPGDIIALKGNLAAGKTTITKGIARALGIKEDITSPTYTLVSEYYGSIPLYHMDMYRIESVEEFELLGIEHLIFGNGLSVIEWSERIEEYLPDEHIEIDIQRQEDGSRQITVKGLVV
ncbi:tRNA (adenosine(37)-N6)-threonylcarbamoyltransferase complex ATPase subunit type 1 TsaE [Spirochaeta isovalerica]|uniref:tRNA threonylcarbamoyladenosine biosynthesis protein TsaE n=1 Tax=Spirochaeta isovalerica TaxID=150 RepID=A0A841R899_9SPIO|nr:tRNA (adenosine(37)-N6)-threonylcarbamoyltransferase complex ATPase subunit type 1 TsaE [Spirochaeta isovalerica]MBB6478692.1 tRNA threonylcarbamoyladenosine biosynthesis protein TsaE [Spirochaeta isovalerica]